MIYGPKMWHLALLLLWTTETTSEILHGVNVCPEEER